MPSGNIYNVTFKSLKYRAWQFGVLAWKNNQYYQLVEKSRNFDGAPSHFNDMLAFLVEAAYVESKRKTCSKWKDLASSDFSKWNDSNWRMHLNNLVETTLKEMKKEGKGKEAEAMAAKRVWNEDDEYAFLDLLVERHSKLFTTKD